MERKLASIQVISDLQPIEGADLIEVATVNSWKLVVKKGEFKIGDLCVYCEIDCFMPDRPEFEFLKPRGMRVRTIKLRGQVSQGLCFPLDILPMTFHEDIDASCTTKEELEGMDVTAILGIIKYEPAIPACLAGKVRGNFPSFIPKTDEERVQNLTKYYDRYRESKFYVTEKLDGSSCTIYLKDGVFGVCSRNLDLLEEEGNSFWKAARKMEIQYKLGFIGFDNIALQGELIGEGIQGNPYKIKGQEIHFFNVFDISTQTYYDFEQFNKVISLLELKTVPIIHYEYRLPDTIHELILCAEGKSVLNKEAEREGLVVRSCDRKVSFKAISNKFLLKEK